MYCAMKTAALLALGVSLSSLLVARVAMADPPPPQPGDAQPPPASTQLQEIIVSAPRRGYRVEEATQVGPFSGLRLQDTPYSVNVTSGALIENRAAHTVSDALQTNPTVATLMESSGYSSLSRVMIRGFTAADQGDLRDGMVDRSFTFVPLENVDRIEVYNGLSSFLYGFGAVGGTINYVSKQPSAIPSGEATVGNYDGGLVYGQVAATGPLDLEKQLTGRLDLYREDGDTTIDHGAQNRTLVSLVANYRLAPETVAKLDFWHQDYTVSGLETYFAPFTQNGRAQIPTAIDPTKLYGQPYTHNQSEKDLLGVGFDSRLNDVFKLRVGYRYGDMWRRYSYVDGQFANLSGAYTELYTDTPQQGERTHAGYALVDADFETGPVQHTVTFGYTGAYYYYQRGIDLHATLGPSTVYAPAYYAPPFHAVLGAVTTVQTQEFDNFLIGDQIAFDPQWSMLVGVNYARLVQGSSGINAGISTANFEQDKASPSASLIYKPIAELSLYATYMQGLVQGGSAPSTFTYNNITKPVGNANAVLAPSVSDQYEVGAKATLGGMFLTAALFRIYKVNEEVDPADFVYKQDGREVHEGLEFTATGKLTDRLTAIGGFTLMRARIDSATALPQSDGKIPINVPEREGRVYFEYRIPGLDALTGSLGVNYFGSRPVDSLNTGFLPDATTVDIGARYETVLFGRDATLNVRVENLFDTAYWSYFRTGDGMLLGPPRTVSAFLKVAL
jgi:iron complex outermembrane receptor protein